MSSRTPARTASRRARSTAIAAVVVASAALTAALASQSLVLSSSAATSSIAAASLGLRPPSWLSLGGSRAAGEAGGVVPDGASVFDDELPAVAGLDPALLGALRQAAADAGGEGVVFHVTSGWRSPERQQHLLDEAVSMYGSAEEAARWVATPTTSLHVTGNAVDLGTAASVWLSRHGSQYGLCQIYDNEPWHYELRSDATETGCPARYADPTRDPRMEP